MDKVEMMLWICVGVMVFATIGYAAGQNIDVPTWLCKSCHRGLTHRCYDFMKSFVCTNDNDNLEMLRVYELLGSSFYGDECVESLRRGFKNTLSTEYGLLHKYLINMCYSL